MLRSGSADFVIASVVAGLLEKVQSIQHWQPFAPVNLDLILICSNIVPINEGGDSMLYSDDTAADFSYSTPEDSFAQDGSGLPSRVAIYADHPGVCFEIVEDLSGAGFRAVQSGQLRDLADGPISLLGDVVLVDCPQAEPVTLAALSRLDMRVAETGAQLLVSTTLEALDSVFAAIDQSDPQILVGPSRAERLVAVGRTLSLNGSARLREMSDQDRLSLLYLSRQVDAIAQELDKLSGPHGGSRESSTSSLSDFKRDFRGPEANTLLNSITKDKLTKELSASLQLPEPQFVRALIAQRQARAKYFEGELFADPAWDMLLDLTAAEGERKSVSVTSLCIAAMVPATTALRWIKQLVDCGVFQRKADPSDKRRAFIELSDQSRVAMSRYFQEVQGQELEVASAN